MNVQQFIAMKRILATTPDTVEQMGYVIMEVFGKTYEQVDAMKSGTFARYVLRLERMVKRKEPLFFKIGFTRDASKITFGQFVEIQYWLQQQGESVLAMDLIAASIMKDQTGSHSKRAKWIGKQKANKVVSAYTDFMKSLDGLVSRYSGLFANDDIDDPEDAKLPDFNPGVHPFIETFGWIFSAKSIAEHEGIKLEEVWGLPVVQALNDLSYLKNKRQFEEYIAKKKK